MRIRASLVASLLLAGVPVPAVAQPAAPDEHGPTAHPSGPTGAVKSELAVLAPAAPITLGAHPVTVVVPIPPSGRGQMAVTAGPAAPATLLLSVDGIKFEKTPEGYFEIYINLPQGEKPYYKSRYYVGNLSFFGLQNQRGASLPGASGRFDITATVRALQSGGAWRDSEMSVTFVPTTIEDSSGQPVPMPPDVRVNLASLRVLAAR